jgi:hypothetical protein
VGLPDRDSAKTWGGKLLVDRDGTEIGTCTQVFVDDATGLPEWAEADLSGGPVVVPLLDAAEAGDRVRVAVLQVDVAGAPRVGDPGHISEDDEERLYRHYGIQFSRENSDSLLPVDEPVAPEAVEVAEPALPDSPDLTASPDMTGSPAEVTSGTEATGGPEKGRRGLLTSLAAGTVGVLAAVAAAVFWWRQRQQLPPTRKDLLAARARAASLALAATKEQVSASAAPLLRSGREHWTVAAQRAAVQAREAAERATVQARVAAGRASVQARAAAEQAAALAAIARTLRIQRVSPDADLELQRVAAAAAASGRRRARVIAALETVGGFAAGYAVGGRKAGARDEQPEQADGQPRRQFQQVAGRVQERVSGTLQAGNAQLSQRAGAVAGKVRRRSGDAGDEGASSGSVDA